MIDHRFGRQREYDKPKSRSGGFRTAKLSQADRG